MWEGLGNLLQNKLFLQYLSGAGADISAGRGLGPNINAITQQNIQAQNFMKMLQYMLGTGGKASMDSTGMKLSIPQTSDLFSSFLGGKESNPEDFYRGIGAMGPAPTTPTVGGRRDFINPFVSSQPEFSAADLAGLTPQDISQALSGATGVEASRVDALYKQSLMDYYGAMTEGLREPKIDPLDEIFDVVIPSLGREVTLREWKELPKDEQEYALYLKGSKAIGDKDPMSKEEFQSLEPTEHEKLLRSLMKHPELLNIEKQLRSAGATKISLGEKVSEKLTMGKLEGQLYFTRGTFAKDLDKAIQEFTKEELYKYESAQGKIELTKFKTRYIVDAIISRNGEILSADWDIDGKTIIWTVKWPLTDEPEKIKYKVR